MRETTAKSATTDGAERLEIAEQILFGFADRTGLTSERPEQRYLWTDAFAVSTWLGLARATGRTRYQDLALELVGAVHRVLGRHRTDDARNGWLSGLSDEEGLRHPTAGGLRIGKKRRERAPGEPFDERLEWERDGQYFHYLTKWMHALDQVARHTNDGRFNLWARELAQKAHDAFVHPPEFAGDPPHMFWKMSIDLSRPLVSSMGQHDALDGFVTALELRATAARLSSAPAEPNLFFETNDFFEMIDFGRLSTADVLGLGGLLSDACRLAQLNEHGSPLHEQVFEALLAAALHGLRRARIGAELRRSPEERLAFRELGLSIGLQSIVFMSERSGKQAHLGALLDELAGYVPLARAIDSFWLDPANRRSHTWSEHLDINEVMLATSLLPEGYLLLNGHERA